MTVYKFKLFLLLPSVYITFLLISSCNKSDQPKCSDFEVQQTLKQAYVSNTNRDTSEITVNAVRTTGKNEEFKICECAAHITAPEKVFSFLYFSPIDQEINYTAQFTDDGKRISVKIHN